MLLEDYGLIGDLESAALVRMELAARPDYASIRPWVEPASLTLITAARAITIAESGAPA